MTHGLDIAPNVSDEDEECTICGTEQPFVLYDGDKQCCNCGYVPRQTTRKSDDESEWSEWRRHRLESDYDGWYGEDRIKFPGGFASAYQFSDDFN